MVTKTPYLATPMPIILVAYRMTKISAIPSQVLMKMSEMRSRLSAKWNDRHTLPMRTWSRAATGTLTARTTTTIIAASAKVMESAGLMPDVMPQAESNAATNNSEKITESSMKMN